VGSAPPEIAAADDQRRGTSAAGTWTACNAAPDSAHNSWSRRCA